MFTERKTCESCSHYEVTENALTIKERCKAVGTPKLPEIALRSNGHCGPSRAGWTSKRAAAGTFGNPALAGGAIPIAPFLPPVTGYANMAAANSWNEIPTQMGMMSPDGRIMVIGRGNDHILLSLRHRATHGNICVHFQDSALPPPLTSFPTVSVNDAPTWAFVAAALYCLHRFEAVDYAHFATATYNPNSVDGH